MIVMKFGGTSVGSEDRIRNASGIVKSSMGKNPVVVVSAVAKVTDMLIALAGELAHGKGDGFLGNIKKLHLDILKKLGLDRQLLNAVFRDLEKLCSEKVQSGPIDPKTLDHFQSFGEQMSSIIFAAQLNKAGIKSQAFNSWDLGFLTSDEFGNAEPLESCYENLKKNIRGLDIVPIVTGFIGKTENGDITTLGRGGSDYSAAIIGAAIDAKEIQIWTDVNGIMSTDPKIVPGAKTIASVSFAEASELAYFGAKVLHPKTILPAMRKNIPVRVLNSFNPENAGTTILNEPKKSERTVKAIASRNNTSLMHIESTRMLGAYGFLARIFYLFDKYGKSVDVVSTSEVSVSLTVDNGESIEKIMRELKEFAHASMSKNKSIICVVGEGMKDTIGMPGKIFTALSGGNIHVEMISMGASEINITFIVDSKDTERAVRVLHKEYFGD